MNRRRFVAALASLPFVGRLVARDVVTLKPGESITTPWMPVTPGMIPPIIPYAGRQPEMVRDPYCPAGQGYLLCRAPGEPAVLIRSYGDEPVRKIWIVDVETQRSLARQWGLA
jgi:hypothetical protein